MRYGIIPALICALLVLCSTVRADKEEKEPFDRVALFGGDVRTGLVEKIDEDGTVHIKALDSDTTFRIQITQLRNIRFNAHKNIPVDYLKKAFIFRLVDGTRITGKLVGWGDDDVTIGNEYDREIVINRSAIRHICMSYLDDIFLPWNSGSKDIIVFENGDKQVECEVLPLEPVRTAGGRLRVEEVEYRVGDETKTVSVADVRGIIFPRKPFPAGTKTAEGWYAQVTMPNYDQISGAIDSMGEGTLVLVTRNAGVLQIDRELISSVTFSTTLRFFHGHTIICDIASNRVVELDMQMKEVWSYNCGSRPCHAKRLHNGNLLITSNHGRWVREVNYNKEIVWKKDRLNNPHCAARLANGNTLIAEMNARRLIEVKPDGTIAAKYFEGQCNPCFFDIMDNGNLLICDSNRVFEGTMANKINASWNSQGPTCARRLPDGKMVFLERRRNHIRIVNEKGETQASIKLTYNVLRFTITETGGILVHSFPGNNWQPPAKLIEYDSAGKMLSEITLPRGGYNIFHMERD